MPARTLPEKFLVAFSLAGEQRELVRAIAEAVEKELGSGTVFLDEWFEHHIAGADADLKLQRIYGQQSTLVVFCVSREYGAKPWTRTEHEVIRARLMKARTANQREQNSILPIRVGEGDIEGVLYNAIAPDVRARSAAGSAQLIIERLRLIEPGLRTVSAAAPVGPAWPENPPVLQWPMANHSRAREAFGELLTSKVGWRFLRIRGVSETGKSHITRQMLDDALVIPGIACGRFDFKGTTDMDREVRAFVSHLDVPEPDVPEPAPKLRLYERLDEILRALRQRVHPTLLIFDTYEMAGEAREWVEKQLLPSLIRATWLRVVIAGQQVPDSKGAVWARPTVQLEPPPPADWYDYAKPHRPDLKLEEVEIACHLAKGKASLLAELLGPPR